MAGVRAGGEVGGRDFRLGLDVRGRGFVPLGVVAGV